VLSCASYDHCTLWQAKKKGAMEQMIAQQRKQIKNKESEMQRLQRLNASLLEQVNNNMICKII
jgi:hypothetical protein